LKRLTNILLACKNHDMEDARQRVIRKFLALSEDKQQKLCDAMGERMAQLKAEWESRLENVGKKVTYIELWDAYAKVTGMGKGGPPPSEESPPNRADTAKHEGKNSP
jgi:hypothetical protein